MQKQRAFSCDVNLPNGYKMQVFVRARDGAWWVQAKSARAAFFIPILKNVPAYEAVDWFAPLISALVSQEQANVLPLELLNRLEISSKNPANAALRAERDRWLDRARKIELVEGRSSDADWRGRTLTLADVTSLQFGPQDAFVTAFPVGPFAGFPVAGLTPQEISALRAEVKEIASALVWETEELDYRPGCFAVHNEHARWADWRDGLIAPAPEPDGLEGAQP